MSLADVVPDAVAVRSAPADRLFVAPWDRLDDDALLAHFRTRKSVWHQPVVDPDETRRDRIDAIVDGRFEFNGATHLLAEPIDWLVNPSSDVEWHILLHKFYYATGLGLAWRDTRDGRYVQRWMQLVGSWIGSTPPGFIAADVTGRRVQNWVHSLHFFVFADADAPVDAAFLRTLLHSLHEQVEFLCANLTAKRNHRTLELLAIFLAGVVFPEMRRSAYWREFALIHTLENIESDLLPDGVHCELSTDYHHLALRNWLQVRTLAAHNGCVVPAAMDRALARALEFSLHVHKPDGIVPSLSDGDARSFVELLREGAALFDRADMRYVASAGAEGTAPEQRVAHFDASGYSIVRSGWDANCYADAQYLVADCGPLGEGNHGHFDALSFELAAFGRSLVVDPGRYTYDESGDVNWRVRFRSTAAHNTVCVDGRTQTRYAPKAIKEASRHRAGSVRHKISGPAPDSAWVERVESASLDLLHGRCASHDYDAVHERCFVFVGRRYWIVSDWLRAPTAHEYILNFQLGAAAQVDTTLAVGACVRVASPGLVVAQPARPEARVMLAQGWVSARYGDKQPAPAFRAAVHAHDADFDTVLVPWRDRAPHLDVVDRTARCEDGRTGSAVLIRLDDGNESMQDGWFHARAARTASPAIYPEWRFGSLRFRGRWLHWRTGADGAVARAVSHAGAQLFSPHGPVPIEVVAP